MKGMRGVMDAGDVPFQSVLFNGRGRRPGDAKSPLTALEVKPGETVRLRLINGSSTYAFRFKLDGHPLRVIAADGMPVRPAEVDDLVLNVGERYGVLLATGRDGGAHGVRAATPDGGRGWPCCGTPGRPGGSRSRAPQSGARRRSPRTTSGPRGRWPCRPPASASCRSGSAGG